MKNLDQFMGIGVIGLAFAHYHPLMVDIYGYVSFPKYTLSNAQAFLENNYYNFFYHDAYVKKLENENNLLKNRIVELDAALLNQNMHTALSRVIGYTNSHHIVIKNPQTGVRKSAVVVKGNTLIGRVDRIGEKYITILSISDNALKIPVKINDVHGISVGAEKGKIKIDRLDRETTNVKINDPVVTSGRGGIYPKDLTIGHVSEITAEHLYADYVLPEDLDYVHVVDLDE